MFFSSKTAKKTRWQKWLDVSWTWGFFLPRLSDKQADYLHPVSESWCTFCWDLEGYEVCLECAARRCCKHVRRVRFMRWLFRIRTLRFGQMHESVLVFDVEHGGSSRCSHTPTFSQEWLLSIKNIKCAAYFWYLIGLWFIATDTR